MLLVGLKKDLRGRLPGCVATDEGRAMADKVHAYQYLECSAKNKDGVQEVFEAATKAALQAPKRRRKPLKCNLL